MSISRFSPLILGNQARLKNRIVVPPMASQTADEQGYVTPETLKHYERLTESGAGLIFVEYSYINIIGKSEPNQLGVASDDHVAGLKKVASLIHASGAKAGLQVTYGGGKSSSKLTGGKLWGPSTTRVPALDRELEQMHAMSLDQVDQLIEDFRRAAVRAERSGFDLVELHCAHGYGLNQWLSPLTNHRTDAYGGNLEARMQLLVQVVTKMRESAPSLLIAARIPGQDFLPGGLTQDDMRTVVKKLEHLGVSLIDVSSGLGGWRRPKERRGEGYLVDEAAAIKPATKLPVIGVGGIEHGRFVDELIQAQKVDLTAIGRAILKDPAAWRKAQMCA